MDSKTVGKAPAFSIAGFRVEPSRLRVTDAATTVRLESKVMQVLVYLAGHAGQTVSRGELERNIWSGRVVTDDTVTNAILKLRRAFGDDARHPRVIETVPKTGYRLIAPVVAMDERPGQGVEAGTATPRPTAAAALGLLVGMVVFGLLLAATVVLWLDSFRVDTASRLFDDGQPAVAVLPFANQGVSPAQDYFANGITADLITDLSKEPGLLVIAPGASFPHKGGGPGQIAAALDVDYVVVGSVQRSGERLRVNVQLIDAGSERALWAERYEGVLHDVFDIQDRLRSAVILALPPARPAAANVLPARHPTHSVVAYDHYLRGVDAHGHRSHAQNLVARGHFQKAIDLDPGFAQAYAGLAMTHSRDAIDGWSSKPSWSLSEAARLATRAAEMDRSLPQVHFVNGQVALFRREHLAAMKAAQRALEANPNYADGHALSAWILNYVGHTEAAEEALGKAMRLNPRPPASYLEILGEIRFVQRRYQDAASVFGEVLNINPGYMRARMWSVAALAKAGFTEAADWEVAELLVANPGFSIAQLEFAFPFKDPRTQDQLLDGFRQAGRAV